MAHGHLESLTPLYFHALITSFTYCTLIWSYLLVKLSLLAVSSPTAEFFTDLSCSYVLRQHEELNKYLLTKSKPF